MSRLDSDTLVPSPGRGAAIPSRRALLSIIGAFAGLVVGLTLASPGRADRQLIERGMELVTPGGFTFNQFLVLGDEPLMIHAGPRKMFGLNRDVF